MLDALQAKDFEPHLNTTFRLCFDDESNIALELIKIEGLTGDTPEDSQRQPFSLVFSCTEKDAYAQQTYRLEHDTMGELAFFLVPIGPGKEGGMCYEAVFS